MRILLATDHAGFDTKEHIKAVLLEKGYEVEDVGAYTYDPADNYPEFIAKAARAVSEAPENTRGVIFGGSGQGEAMVANRFSNVRAAVFYGQPTGGSGAGDIVSLSRNHNDANMLSIGARFVDKFAVEEVVLEWLETPFSHDERHVRRIAQMEDVTE